MKKIFTLLLLAALFAMPRSVQAGIDWQIATGNEWRINPDNPGDPNDSIRLTPGTKFFYLRGIRLTRVLSYWNDTTTIWILCPARSSDALYREAYDINNFNNQLNSARAEILRRYGYGNQPFSAYNLERLSSRGNETTNDRVIIRFLGYDYFPHREQVYYNNSYQGFVNKYGDTLSVRDYYDYSRKLIMTEEEALAKTKLDLSPLTYGLDLKSPLHTYHFSPDFKIFKNIKEADLTNMYFVNTNYYDYDLGYTRNTINFDTIANYFPNLEKLKFNHIIDGNEEVTNYTYHINLSCLPKLKYLEIGASFRVKLTIENHPSLETLVITNNMAGNYSYYDDQGVDLDQIIIKNNPKLTKIYAEGASYNFMDCANGILEELKPGTFHVLHCQNNSLTGNLKVEGTKDNNLVTIQHVPELICSGNMLTSLTLGPTAKLGHLECQNNNLSSISWEALDIPAVYAVEPSINRYFHYNDDGNTGSVYEFRDIVVSEQGDTISRWYKHNFIAKDVEYYYDADYNEYYYDYYDSESGKYIYYNARYLPVENPSIPVDYVSVLKQPAVYTPDAGMDELLYFDCSGNSPLSSLSLSNAKMLQTLYCYNNNLTSLDLTACTSLKKLRMSHNKISQINISNCTQLEEIYARNRNGERGFSGWNHGLTSLDCSGLKNLHTVLVPRNKMTSLNMSGCEALRTLQCEAQGGDTVRLLDTLNLTGCTNLTTLECQNNGLISLNISDTKLANNLGNVKAYMQRNEKDVVVIDRDKVCIELVNGVTPAIADNGTISDTDMTNYFGTWDGSGFDKNSNKVIKRNGKTYLVIYDIGDNARGSTQRRADVDFYGKQLKYQYALQSGNWNETLGGSLANSKKTDNVTVTTYPYVMYINPLTLDVYTDPDNSANHFYSGTIYLDYDAVVPPGTEVYIAQGLQLDREGMITGGENTTSGQLNLVKIEKAEGATNVVIPAYTPVYVKSPSETGLFDFARNLANEPLATIPNGNIFKGTLRDTTVTPYDILTLSRGYKTGGTGPDAQSRVGFWRFNNTLLPAHRVYIEATEMDKVNASGVRGLTFAFFDSESDLPTSIDRMERVTNTIEQQQRGWYTVSGIRLKDKPSAKGVYIHNGKKVFIN